MVQWRVGLMVDWTVETLEMKKAATKVQLKDMN
jgi:hypothetical protein